MKNGPEKDLIAIYKKRFPVLSSQIGIASPVEQEHFIKKKISGAELKKAEAEALIKSSAPQEILIALDENGEDLSSEQFAQTLSGFRDEGVKSIRFMIGGAEGLDADLLEKSRKTVRFGRMTWPHKLARALLYEQIYRAFTLIAGTPYHKA